MARAITSFPVPVSPWINTAQSTGATMSIWLSTARNFGLDPIKSIVVTVLLLYACQIYSPFSCDQTGLRLCQRGTRGALCCAECWRSLLYTRLRSRLKLMRPSPEKVDQFFRRFEARVFSGHYVFYSSGETG